jgi:hypothetical protein
MTPLVNEIIKKAYDEKAEFLDLGNCGLISIPDEIKILSPFLRKLNFGTHFKVGEEYIASRNKEPKNDFSGSVHLFEILTSFSQSLLG